MFSIKAAFAGWIENIIIFHQQQQNLQEQTEGFVCIEYDITVLNELSKQELDTLILDSHSVEFFEDYINCTIKLTDAEFKKKIQKKVEHYKNCIKSNICRLKKACERSDDNKQSILSYIERNNLEAYFDTDWYR